MKNMKKFSGLIALICVLLSVMLLVCACGKTQDDPKATTEDGTQASTQAPTIETPTTEEPTTGGNDDPVTPPDDGKVTYKVTVLGEDGKAIENVSVQMCDDAGCKLPASTNAEGVVEFRYASSNYHVTILSAPAGYVVDTTLQYHFTNNELKIVLKKAPATLTYKVEVVDHEGFVLEGITVALSGSTLPAVKTNADGVATFTATEGTYGVELADIPEGFACEASYSFPAGKTEVKIALKALPKYTLTAQDLFGQMVAGVEVNVYRKDSGNLVATKITGADGKVTFYLAEAEYTVTASNPIGYTLTSTALEFSATNKNLVAYYLDGVSGEKSYQVVVMDTFYQGLADVKVTIYKTSDNSLVREVLTNELGMVDIMLPVDDYYAVIEMPDGYSVPENKFSFNEDRVAEVLLEGGEAPSFNYSVLVQDSNMMPIPGVTVTLMNPMTGMIAGTAVSGPDGVATFENVPDGMYMGTVMPEHLPAGYTLVYDAYFYGMKDSSLGLEREPTGAEDAPFPIEDEETSVTLEAGKTVYYMIASPAGKFLTVNNANVVIKIGDVVYTPVDGVLTIAFESYDYDSKLLAVSTADGAAAEFTIVFQGAAGSYDNPIVLETLGDNTANVIENGDPIYYKWIATQSGVLVFKTNNPLNNCNMINVTKEWYGMGTEGGSVLFMTVEAGDEILINIDTVYDMATFTKPAAEILFNLSVVSGDETAPLDMVSKGTGVFILAGGKLCYNIPNPAGMKFVLQAGWGENPVVTYNGTQYTVDGEGMIKIVFEGSDPVVLTIFSEGTLSGTSFTISNANGSGTWDDPFLIGELGTITASVPANGEVLYTWTATATGTLTLTMTNPLNNVSLSNMNTWASSDFTMGALTTSLAVNEGDVIQISVSTTPDESWNCPAADIEITLTLA